MNFPWRICILKNYKSLNKKNTGTVIYLILNTYDMLVLKSNYHLLNVQLYS